MKIKLLLVGCVLGLVAGCKIAIMVPSGGDVVSSNAAHNCAEASLCEFEINSDQLPFSETLTAIPKAGYVFEKWSDGGEFQCGKSTSPTCTISIADSAVGFAAVSLFDSGYAMPIFKHIGIDTDGDGIRNELDEDDDNDGVLDADDNCPLEGPNLDGFGCPVVPTKTVFVTSESYTGNLGGLAGADQKCNALATTAGLSGTYMAWLSVAPEDPSTRFTRSTVPYALTDGTVIAGDWDDLVGPEGDRLEAPISIDEAGYQRDTFVWTNTEYDGERILGESSLTCSGFTESTSQFPAVVGWSLGKVKGNSVEGAWTFRELTSTGPPDCNYPAALYCFEQ